MEQCNYLEHRSNLLDGAVRWFVIAFPPPTESDFIVLNFWSFFIMEEICSSCRQSYLHPEIAYGDKHVYRRFPLNFSLSNFDCKTYPLSLLLSIFSMPVWGQESQQCLVSHYSERILLRCSESVSSLVITS